MISGAMSLGSPPPLPGTAESRGSRASSPVRAARVATGTFQRRGLAAYLGSTGASLVAGVMAGGVMTAGVLAGGVMAAGVVAAGVLAAEVMTAEVLAAGVLAAAAGTVSADTAAGSTAAGTSAKEEASLAAGIAGAGVVVAGTRRNPRFGEVLGVGFLLREVPPSP